MKVLNPWFIERIVSSHDDLEQSGERLDDVQMSSSNQKNVREENIPVDFSVFREMHTVEVDANVNIELHSHESPMFRYITNGSLKLNGTEYKEGDWMLVPRDTKYRIEAGPQGYRAACWCGIWNKT